MKKKSYLKWSWVFMIAFIMLSILDIRFGLLGLICMTVPVYHALRGRGKIHCSHYCPRGSLLGNFLGHISLGNNLPSQVKRKNVKNLLLGFMIVMFTISLARAGLNLERMAFTVFRMMMSSLSIGVIMGVVFKPRSWCQVCPMGHATSLLK
jgi:hypothetical protein